MLRLIAIGIVLIACLSTLVMSQPPDLLIGDPGASPNNVLKTVPTGGTQPIGGGMMGGTRDSGGVLLPGQMYNSVLVSPSGHQSTTALIRNHGVYAVLGYSPWASITTSEFHTGFHKDPTTFYGTNLVSGLKEVSAPMAVPLSSVHYHFLLPITVPSLSISKAASVSTGLGESLTNFTRGGGIGGSGRPSQTVSSLPDLIIPGQPSRQKKIDGLEDLITRISGELTGVRVGRFAKLNLVEFDIDEQFKSDYPVDEATFTVSVGHVRNVMSEYYRELEVRCFDPLLNKRHGYISNLTSLMLTNLDKSVSHTVDRFNELSTESRIGYFNYHYQADGNNLSMALAVSIGFVSDPALETSAVEEDVKLLREAFRAAALRALKPILDKGAIPPMQKLAQTELADVKALLELQTQLKSQLLENPAQPLVELQQEIQTLKMRIDEFQLLMKGTEIKLLELVSRSTAVDDVFQLTADSDSTNQQTMELVQSLSEMVEIQQAKLNQLTILQAKGLLGENEILNAQEKVAAAKIELLRAKMPSNGTNQVLSHLNQKRAELMVDRVALEKTRDNVAEKMSTLSEDLREHQRLAEISRDSEKAMTFANDTIIELEKLKDFYTKIQLEVPTYVDQTGRHRF